ncbi:hypothetical protein [Streptomyces sp. NPDC003710]
MIFSPAFSVSNRCPLPQAGAADRLAVREIAAANVLTALLPVLDAVDRACAN